MTNSYKDLIVWQKAIELTKSVYELTDGYPKSELFTLTSQMRRSAISIPSNIAEGCRRQGKKELKQFLAIAYGSGAELETQIEISKRLPLGKDVNFSKTDSLLLEIMKMLNKMLVNLRSN